MQEDVGANGTSEIADTDDQCLQWLLVFDESQKTFGIVTKAHHSHIPLPGRREVVAHPTDDADDRRIDARRDSEENSVCEAWVFRMRDRQERDERTGCDHQRDEDVRPACLVSVG